MENQFMFSFTVNVNIVAQFPDLINEWCKHFPSADAFLDLVIQLTGSCSTGGIQIINLLLDCIASSILPETVQHYCHLILGELQPGSGLAIGNRGGFPGGIDTSSTGQAR